MIHAAYQDARGEPVVLAEELGAGGEGSVFALRGRPDLCAKIYRPDKAVRRADKVRAMLVRRPSWLLRRALAWPVAPLHTAHDATFAGFVMPTRRGMIELFRLIVPDERMQIAGWLTQRDLCGVAARLAGVVAGVHRAGHCVGDLKPQNILVAPTSGRVALIDTDSFQICDPRSGSVHRSIVVTPEYAAPELIGRDLAAVDRTPASDRFALAVLIHQILLGGAHPFAGELAPGHGGGSVEHIHGRIRRGLCPLVPGAAAIRPAHGALPLATLPVDLRELFTRCFGPGHTRPSERPSAAQWQRALARASEAMVRCPESHVHTYARELARCPWCERREQAGIDLFPAGQRWQRSLASCGDLAGAPDHQRQQWLRRHIRGRLIAGEVTPAERAWLEKTGAAIGFDRAHVARTITAESSTGIRARLAALLAPVSGARAMRRPCAALLAASCVAAGVYATATPGSSATGHLDPRPAHIERGRAATVGNTRGAGVFQRATPSRTGDKQRLRPGTRVLLTGRVVTADELDWSEVEALGRTGWVATKYLVPE